ncbi:Uncharacterized protein OBRU01_10771 [Operophtera brumata]|uniref:Telomere-associated protein RIF1 n=1 Tax=Operophtera brumata TaxID=104452 RepID=A0A0L7LD27_OPEBR|nr:Uncharacterized protein OBRU01_10771 [Operophtera brumata]
MPEDTLLNLEALLCSLEERQSSPDDAMHAKKSHCYLLKSLNSLLSCGEVVTSTDADRVFRICLQYKTDMRCVTYVFSIISTLINIDKEKPLVDFLPSALALLDVLKTTCDTKTSHLQKMSFQVLMSHPQSTLIKLVSNHSPELIETFRLCLTFKPTGEALDVKMERPGHLRRVCPDEGKSRAVRPGGHDRGFHYGQAAGDDSESDGESEEELHLHQLCLRDYKASFILLRLLEWLPAQEKSLFVIEGISLWLSHVVPILVEFLTTSEDKEKTETHLHHVELLTKELVLHDYFEFPEFPLCIKALFEKGRDTWHRIWILLVKLLKSHITRIFIPFGTTPVTSMLPVIETAFKKESTQRVCAFTCWNELILSFSNELNASSATLAKRIKLIVIPLRAINARTEDAIAAKFDSWWLFIQKFKPIIDKFTKEILILFLNFVFGKSHDSKPLFWASQLSQSMRKKCLEAFVEIVGHSDCTVRCTTVVAPLNGKLTSTMILADHWDDFAHALKSAIKLLLMDLTPAARANIRCIWKSYVLLVAELLDNTVRRDLFNGLINLLSGLVKDCETNVDLSKVLIEDLALPLFNDNRVLTLIYSINEEHRPAHKIVTIITDKTFDNYYKSIQSQDLMKMLEPLVKIMVNESVATPAFMIWLLDELSATEGSFKLWTALVRTATESDLCLQLLNVHIKLDKTGFDNEISKLLTKHLEASESENVKYFIMFALIGLLKNKPDKDKMAKLEALAYEMDNYKDFEQLIPALVDTLALIIYNVSTNEDINLAQITIKCVKNVLRVLSFETESSGSPSKSRETDLRELRASIPSINKTMLSDIIMTAMKTYIKKCSNQLIKNEIRNVIASLDTQATKRSNKFDVDPIEFASPKVKITKRKEARIVNTVVENGEEYVVVETTWKLNPKSYTENQKEKFHRKSDIPALYQDLSQSQDEYKHSTWTTDSQDTSLSSSKSSKSAAHYNATEILKNMASIDVVPKIMEHILDNDKATPQTDPNTSPVTKDKPPSLVSKDRPLKIKLVPPLIGTKSPRMALKDRVFRNVRNLIEKSSPSPENEFIDKQENMNQIENVSTSPVTKPIIDSLVNSAIQETMAKPKNDDNPVTDKQEKQSPKISNEPDDKKKGVIVTAKQNHQNIRLVCTPVIKSRKQINDTISNSLLSAERPARMKRKPKKFDDSMLLAYKKSRYSKSDSMSDSQISEDIQPEITVAQVHTSKEKSDNSEKDIEHAEIVDKTVSDEAINVRNENNAHTDTDKDVIVLDNEIVMNCDIPKRKDKITLPTLLESYITEEIILITPTTPSVDKPTEQSPEKPTTIGEVPSSKSKASQPIESDASLVTKEIDEDLSTVNTTLCRQLVKKSVTQRETNENDVNSDSVTTPLNENKEASQDKVSQKKQDLQTENNKNEQNLGVTPKNKVKDVTQKSSTKKSKKSRIESELMIDTVEGHPFLKVQSENKRITRKFFIETENSSRRKSLAEKLNKSKMGATRKTSKKTKEKKTSSTLNTVTVEDSQDRRSISPEDAVMAEPPCSEDIIESSQDSTITTISVKSSKRTPKLIPFVALEKVVAGTTETQDLLEDSVIINEKNHEGTDIELLQNKTAEVDKNTANFTENMDTEPIGDNENTTDLTENMDTEQLGYDIAPNDFDVTSEPVVGPETQELAEADTQLNDPDDFVGLEIFEVTRQRQPFIYPSDTVIPEPQAIQDSDIKLSLPHGALILANIDNTNEVSSPFKDDSQRKQDFLNNTLEISPIKILSPDREKESPSPENSSDFVVIKLTSPVQSNGEPFQTQGSPEFFSEDKVSPDKRNASPPRADVTVTNTSPSSSLSLKKNRPQVRPGGRAAQMLGLLCVNSDLKITKVCERTEPEESKKAGTSTPARRNLRILYNSAGDVGDNLPEQSVGEGELDNFLKLKRTLPTVTSSPSGPILKRKLVDIIDEATASPASKRKRVSFHDPPVSTTAMVHKYIEPISLARSPQGSMKKRLERQTRAGIKSPKKLENVFNLDSVLSKTVESFTETATPTDDTQNVSLDITPTVEIVKTNELNDTDPIYPDLIDCKEPILVIATELSSTAMRELLVKELKGKVATVGDLAKMTELEVNRLCIKAPKIKIAKKVLTDYAAQRPVIEIIDTIIQEAFSEPMTESLLTSKTASVEMQTDEVELSSTGMQTVPEKLVIAATQTEIVPTAHTSIQTDESGKTLPPKSMVDLLMKKGDESTSPAILNRLLKLQRKGAPKDKKSTAELSFLRDHLCERYDSKDLFSLGLQLLQTVHDNSA